MAKKTGKVVDNEKRVANVASQKKESVEESMPLFKYFLVVDPSIHPYTRASLLQQYKGIMKTGKEWRKETKSYEKGV